MAPCGERAAAGRPRAEHRRARESHLQPAHPVGFRRDWADNLRGGSTTDGRASHDRQQHHLVHEAARDTSGIVRARLSDR